MHIYVYIYKRKNLKILLTLFLVKQAVSSKISARFDFFSFSEKKQDVHGAY